MAEEIEVTPEMVDAGLGALGKSRVGPFVVLPANIAFERQAMLVIYRGMEAKRREQASNRDPGDETKGTK